jgi:hypothetical protein
MPRPTLRRKREQQQNDENATRYPNRDEEEYATSGPVLMAQGKWAALGAVMFPTDAKFIHRTRNWFVRQTKKLACNRASCEARQIYTDLALPVATWLIVCEEARSSEPGQHPDSHWPLVRWRGIIISASPSMPFRTARELVTYAQSNPGKLNFASGGAILQITGEIFKQEAKIDIKHVPYRGSVQAVTDTLAGHVGLVVTGTASIVPHFHAGKLVPIAVASAVRTKTAPSVPTFVESGYPGVIMANWFGLLGPKGLSQSIVDRINKGLSEIIGDVALKGFKGAAVLTARLTVSSSRCKTSGSSASLPPRCTHRRVWYR